MRFALPVPQQQSPPHFSVDIIAMEVPDQKYDGSRKEEDAASVSSVSSTGDGSLDPELQQHDQLVQEQKQEVRGIKDLAKKETRRLLVWKWVLGLSILATASTVTALTYKFLSQSDADVRQQHFRELAKGVCDAVEFHADNLFTSMSSAALSVSGAALVANATFPYVTVPAFEVLGQTTRAQSGIEFLLFTPLITDETKEEWGRYSEKNQWWVAESRELALASAAQEDAEATIFSSDFNTDPIKPYLFEYDLDDPDLEIAPTTKPPYFPIWQMSPAPFDASHIVNFNRASKPFFESHLASVLASSQGTLSPVFNPKVLSNWATKDADHDAYHAQFVTNMDGVGTTAFERPHCGFMQPVFKDMYDPTSEVVATMQAGVPWDRYMVNLLPPQVQGIQLVLSNTCGQSYTYELDGNLASYVGEGDLHDLRYSHMLTTVSFGSYDERVKEVAGHCMYTFNMYPTEAYMKKYESNTPIYVTIAIAASFLIMLLAFIGFDQYVTSRNNTIVTAAARSNVLLGSLFPKAVRDRLVAEREQQERKMGAKTQLKSFLNSTHELSEGSGSEEMVVAANPFSSKPIADLFPNTTIMFADIAGFTAWSSVREPSQVFTLLETLYNCFDSIAQKRDIYKVETIGDCYVAVTGLPEPRNDHAVAMVRFARECMSKMHSLTNHLEVTLGPGTCELELRVGLHSGPVTAGVLRGQRSRFQLFGDTMNTASRMESTGVRGKIQCSKDTADLLLLAGKSKLVTPREDLVHAKGKGEMQTYWISLTGSRAESSGGSSNTASCLTSSDTSNVDEFPTPAPPPSCASLLAEEMTPRRLNHKKKPKKEKVMDDKTKRLVSWNVDIMAGLLKKIVARRGQQNAKVDRGRGWGRLRKGMGIATQRSFRSLHCTVLEEVEEVVELPELDEDLRTSSIDPNAVELDPPVIEQLESFVTKIASMYDSRNPFHNFEHASHVTSSVVKLLGRIVAPDLDIDATSNSADYESVLHDTTYGITSDPLTQFACIFSAFIHDVDHCGVPNLQLMKENPQLAKFYKNKSVAEQNSVDVAWYLLMEGKYPELRAVIFQTDEEKKRFRQLIVNSVMATDIMDPDLKQLRNARWEKAFSDAASVDESKRAVDRKATIVIEHLIQASDVSHTMQHWHVFRKWNECLFQEMYKAYQEGRADKDPSETWYKGEIGFFDFYIIPLAKKLKECGVFGVSSDEYLNYAVKNREEWVIKGEGVVAEMLAKAKAKAKNKASPHP